MCSICSNFKLCFIFEYRLVAWNTKTWHFTLSSVCLCYLQFWETILFLFIPLSSSGDCSPVSRPTTWLMFATPLRGLELSEIWGLFIQICEILSQQWNWVFSPSSYFPVLYSNVEHYILREQIFPFHAQKFRSFIGSRTRVLLFRSPMFFHCTSRPRPLRNYFK